MTETNTPAPPPPEGSSVPQAPPVEKELHLPGWIPPAIGIALVLLGAMAVYTGFRPRTKAADRMILTEPSVTRLTSTEDSGGAPGAPEPGASRVLPGETGEVVPEPGPMPAGSIAPISVRRGVIFDVEPKDAMVYVNDAPIGPASQFASKTDVYEFAQSGAFRIRLVAPGYRDAEFQVTAEHDGDNEVATIKAVMKKNQ
jgi:hypothetical protein